MINDNNDSKYKDVIESLKSLPKISAPQNFETGLQRKINSQVIDKKKSFLEKFFIPSRLVPSSALAISAVVLFFVLFNNSDLEDPLLMEPKIREDFISEDNMLVIYLPVSNSLANQRNEEESYSGVSELRNSDADLYFSNNYYLINKKGLNFRQVLLTKEEQNKIKQLKEQLLKTRENN